MNGYRKRRSSDILEGDIKRISLERYEYDSYIKQEPNPHVTNNGGQNYVAVPYNYNAPVGIQSAVAYNEPLRYYNNQYLEQYNSDQRNVVSSMRNYSSGYGEAISLYDNRRRMNFKHECYIDSLRQSEPRYVNFTDLQRHLYDVDIRHLNNWNFSTALDLTQELESSLKYFVDTRNEMVFLRKLQRQQCFPFSYNEINITNRDGIYNRMRFLENESAYRSNRMNSLFHELQSAVIPSIIDDIRYVHSVSYKKSWTNRARYWFSQFKRIQWGKGLLFQSRANQYRHSQRSHRGHTVKAEVDVASHVNIKSEVNITPKTPPFDGRIVKIEKKVQLKDTTLHSQAGRDLNLQSDKSNPTMSNIVEETLEPSDHNNNLVSDKNLESEPAETVAQNEEKIDVGAAKESDLSNSFVIIEPNISLVDVTDDENHDSSNNTNPSEGDINN